MSRNKISFGLIIAMMAIIIGCEREFDAPPGHTLQFGEVITIDSLRALHDSVASYKFTVDRSFYGVATTDESSGNFYKEFYVQDEETGSAIHLNLLDPGGISKGDRVRIRLKGLTMERSNELLELTQINPADDDGIYIDSMVFIQANGIHVEPQVMALNNANGYYESFESRLVTIPNLQLIDDEICENFANGVTGISFNRTVEDCNGNEIILRNSGFANFADELMPTGNGNFTGILGRYNDDWQVYLRDPDDMEFTDTRCNGEEPFDCGSVYLSQGFSDGNIAPWESIIVYGNDDYNWTTGSLGNPSHAPYAVIDNFEGGNTALDAWLVSPSIDLTDATAPFVSFISAKNYDGDPMEVYVSMDYNSSGVIDMGEWTLLDPILAPEGFFIWTSSGELDLTPYISDNVHVAFRYIGTDNDGSTWEVDNIIVSE